MFPIETLEVCLRSNLVQRRRAPLGLRFVTRPTSLPQRRGGAVSRTIASPSNSRSDDCCGRSSIQWQLARRTPGAATLTAEVDAWRKRRNTHNAKANWHFTTADARVKLKSLHPSL
jgi:hypothetical protein